MLFRIDILWGYFRVSPNTVYLLQKLFYETSSLEPHFYPHERSHLITDEGEMYLRLLLIKECDLTLAELCDRYEQAYGVRVSIGTMFNTLERLNITRKKKAFYDPKKESETAIKELRSDLWKERQTNSLKQSREPVALTDYRLFCRQGLN